MNLRVRNLLGPVWRTYQRAWIPRDLMAGVTVAAITIPAGLAYAQLAGLPPVFGLYASLVPLVVFAIFSSSRFQVVGPDATLSAVIGSVLAAVTVMGTSGGDAAKAAQLAPMLGLMVGVLFIVMGVLKLGFIANFLSKSLLIGFISGMAVEILVAQLPKMLGYSVDSDGTVPQFVATIKALGQTNGWSVLIAVVGIAALIVVPRYWRRFPIALLVIVLGIVAVAAFSLVDRGVNVLGEVPTGLPPLAVPFTTWNDMVAMLPGALAIVLIGFADQALEARTWAAKGHYEVDANRDLVALGLANAAGSFAGSYPVGSSGSRTAAGISAGARSQLASISAAGVIAVVLLFLSGLLSDLPQAVLGAVVAVSAARLIDIQGFASLRHRPVEMGIAVLTAIGVIVFGVLPGVGIAVVISLLDVVRRVSSPHDAVLGHRPGRIGYFDISRSDATTIPGLLIYRFDAPLFFANADRFRSRIRHLVREAEVPVRWIIIEASAIVDVDATAMEVLEELFDGLSEQGITVAFAESTGKLRDRVRGGRPVEAPGEDLPPSAADAGKAAKEDFEARPLALGETPRLLPEGLMFKTTDEAVEAFNRSPQT